MELNSLPSNPDSTSSVIKKNKFNTDEFILKNRWPLTFGLIGITLVGLGVFFAKNEGIGQRSNVEVLEATTEAQKADSVVVVEVSGAVESPGVYEMTGGSRIEDALIAAGGVSSDADRIWMEKFLNRAAEVSDGQKVYIPRESEQSDSGSSMISNPVVSGVGGVVTEGRININTASQNQLESLWGIGPVYAQNIIEQRPYSSVEELLSKGVIKQNVYDRNKDKLTVY